MAKQVAKAVTKAKQPVTKRSSVELHDNAERPNGKQVATTTDEDLLNALKSSPGGLSKDQADNLIPFIYVLQPLSPQVMKGDAARIEGAEAGDIWLRNGPVIKGEDGMLFQPC